MKQHVFIGLLLLLVLSACHSPQREARHMVARAERLFDTLPDSTASLIDSVLRMPVYFNEKRRMDMALLQAEALMGDRGQEIPPLMDDEFFDDKPFFSTSPELERAADYYAKNKKYAKAAHAALYSGFVQQHYNDKAAAMQSFKDAEHYGKMVKDSLTVARAEYKMGRMLYYDGTEQEALLLLKNAENLFGNRLAEKSLLLNFIAGCYLVFGDYDNTELYLKQSLILSKKGHVDKVTRKVLNNYAVLFRLQNKHDQSIASLRQIEKESNLDDTEWLLLNMNLGDVFLEINEIDSADLYFKNVEAFLPKAHVKNENIVSAYKSLSQFAECLHDDSLALYYWKHYNRWLNETRDQREQNNVYGIQRKYDYGTLQNVMSQKVIRRQRIIIVLSIVAALVLLAFALSQIRLARIRKQEAEIKASLLRFMQQNEELAKQSETVKKAHDDLEQKHQETKEAYQSLAGQVEEYKTAFEAADHKLSKAYVKQQQIMQKMAVYLENEKDLSLFDSLKYSILGNQDYWDAMLKTFDKQFPGMRKKLVLQYPELTEMEQKILLLSIVDASREDTAALLDISVFMVDKLRTNVKKKMGKNVPKASEMA